MSAPPIERGEPHPLGRCSRGYRGEVVAFAAMNGPGFSADIERRLLEMGFVEGARVELLHEGWFGGDPIAVRVDEATVAVRRRDADVVLVQPLDGFR